MKLLWIPFLAAAAVCSFFGILYGNNIARYGFMDDDCKLSRKQAQAIEIICSILCVTFLALTIIVAKSYTGIPD